MEIYLDILFLVNFIMDFLLINITADIMALKPKLHRSLISATLGGAIGIFAFCGEMRPVPSACTLWAGAALMIFAAFFPKKPKELAKLLLVFLLSSALFSGAVMLCMMNMDGGVIKNGVFYMSSLKIMLICAAIYFSVRLFVSRLKRRAAQKISEVILEYCGKRIKLSALTDTGNGLTDPISGKPVMLIELCTLRQLIGAECCISNICEWVEADRIKFIPYRTIDKEGCLTGIVLDRVYIDGVCRERVIAAVCENKLKYPAILHAGI